MWPFTSDSSTGPHPEAPPSQCPVDSTTREAWSKNSTSNNNNPNNPNFNGPNRLSKDREISSIPRWINPQHPDTFPDDIPATACPAKSAPAPVSSSSNLNSNSSNSTSSNSTSTTSSTSTSTSTSTSALPIPKDENWVYPSPASFYSALERKERDPQARDMPIVVPIHNAVNERVWEQVLEWEKDAILSNGGELLDNGKPGSKLVSFIGKPKELSPRARFKGLIGYSAPFDRHDWIVDRPIPISPSTPIDPSLPPPSIRVRYIIDFYTGRSLDALNTPDKGSAPVGSEDNFKPNLAFYIDTRPALDGYEGIRMRAGRFMKGFTG